jgi:hypothetical protein
VVYCILNGILIMPNLANYQQAFSGYTNSFNKMIETMHIRWERRKSMTEWRMAQYQIVALLVEGSFSEEDENAKVLAKLGSIQERFLSIPISKTRAFHQGLFWAKVDQKILKPGLEEEVRQTLEAQISEKVPRPGDDWALWGVTCIPHIDCK